MHTGSKHIVTQARATANHLQELDLGLDFLEKYQVQHIRHVNTGVHHIHGNRHLGQLIPLTKVIDQTQFVYDMAVNQQINEVREKSKAKTFDQLTATLEQWEI